MREAVSKDVQIRLNFDGISMELLTLGENGVPEEELAANFGQCSRGLFRVGILFLANHLRINSTWNR